MPSLQDSVVIFILALMLVGPKNLPKLARQLGKLMAEFRRASNEFRMQMEDELRVEEQKEHEAKVAALAGPASDVSTSDPTEVPAAPQPIAEAGELKMMPPSTGLPVQQNSYTAHEDTTPEVHPDNSILNAGVSSDEPTADEASQEAHQAHAGAGTSWNA